MTTNSIKARPSTRTGKAARRLIAATMLGAMLLSLGGGVAEAAPSVKARIKGLQLTVSGSPAADVIVLRLAAHDPTILEVDGNGDGSADFSFDRARFSNIEVTGAGGNDTIRIDEHLTALDGGAGNDSLTGGSGPQALFGGAGHDRIDGGLGSDSIDAGPGDDIVTWEPGDASDYVWGDVGFDTLLFTGGNVDEQVAIAAASSLVRITRNVGNVAMHLDDMERVELSMLRGSDTVTVDDLAAADVTEVAVDLAGAGGGDGTSDGVIVNGSTGDDVVSVAAVGSGVDVSRVGTATVRVTGAEPLLDVLIVNGQAGHDLIDVMAGVEALIHVVSNP
jgi:Ca2+-binding RTX toxin-like protein